MPGKDDPLKALRRSKRLGKRQTTPQDSPISEEKFREILEEAHRQARDYCYSGHHGPATYTVGLEVLPESPFTEAEVAQFQLYVQELARREKEALAIYAPLPFQRDFHRSHAPERSIRGSNRSGKTLSAAVEFGRAVTGQDPYNKYPRSGRAFVVAKDEKKIGEVIYPKLFKPGAFKVIRDETTKKWRTYDPETDNARKKERRNAPPIIPRRFYSIKDLAWSKKKEEIPKKIKIRVDKDNEWEVSFFSSLGEAPQGVDVDLIWFDEEIEHPSWYNEMAMRLIDRSEWDEERQCFIGGKFFWSATPQAGTLRLFEIHRRAAEEIGKAHPAVTEHHATMFDNKYLPERAREVAIAKLAGNEEEIRVRIYGEFALTGMRVYPEFDPGGVHGCLSFPIPDNWCRYIAVDPGFQVCAVLFAAVPPPSHKDRDRIYIYDELYIKHCDAEKFAEALAHKIGRQNIHEAIMDHHMGRYTEVASGLTVEEQYRRALLVRKVRFGSTNGVSFTWGSDDVPGRITAVHSWLFVGPDDQSRVVVFRDQCDNLVKEMERYCYKKNKLLGVMTNEPLKINDHLCDCMAYLAMHGLPYRRPRSTPMSRGNYAFQYLQDKKARNREKDGWGRSVKVG